MQRCLVRRAHEKLKLKEVPLIILVQCGKNNTKVIRNIQIPLICLIFLSLHRYWALCLTST